MWNLVGKTGFLMIMQSRLPSHDLTTAKESIVKTEEKVLWFTFKAGGYYLDSSTQQIKIQFTKEYDFTKIDFLNYAVSWLILR